MRRTTFEKVSLVSNVVLALRGTLIFKKLEMKTYRLYIVGKAAWRISRDVQKIYILPSGNDNFRTSEKASRMCGNSDAIRNNSDANGLAVCPEQKKFCCDQK